MTRLGRGLILIAGLALFTYGLIGKWSSNETLWATNAATVRAHVNARQADLDSGHILEAIDECSWLLHAAATGHPVEPRGDQLADISRICLQPLDSSRSRR